MQNEIDSVVGNGRLPTLDDRIKYGLPFWVGNMKVFSDNANLSVRSLSYTEATVREIMRFETLVPSGLPHRALEDTEFEGYVIPKVTNTNSLIHFNNNITLCVFHRAQLW